MAKIPAKTSTALKRAKARLKGRWCQGSYYRTKAGHMCSAPGRESACCAYGALNIVLGAARKPLRDLAALRVRASAGHVLDRIAYRHGFASASAYNDAPNRTEAEVLKLFDSAIEYCRKRGD